MKGDDAGRGGEEGQVALEARDLLAGRPPQRSVHRLEPIGRQALVGLVQHAVGDLRDPGHLVVAGEIEVGERALAQLARRAHQGCRAPALAEGLEKGDALTVARAGTATTSPR